MTSKKQTSKPAKTINRYIGLEDYKGIALQFTKKKVWFSFQVTGTPLNKSMCNGKSIQRQIEILDEQMKYSPASLDIDRIKNSMSEQQRTYLKPNILEQFVKDYNAIKSQSATDAATTVPPFDEPQSVYTPAVDPLLPTLPPSPTQSHAHMPSVYDYPRHDPFHAVSFEQSPIPHGFQMYEVDDQFDPCQISSAPQQQPSMIATTNSSVPDAHGSHEHEDNHNHHVMSTTVPSTETEAYHPMAGTLQPPMPGVSTYPLATSEVTVPPPSSSDLHLMNEYWYRMEKMKRFFEAKLNESMANEYYWKSKYEELLQKCTNSKPAAEPQSNQMKADDYDKCNVPQPAPDHDGFSTKKRRLNSLDVAPDLDPAAKRFKLDNDSFLDGLLLHEIDGCHVNDSLENSMPDLPNLTESFSTLPN